MDEGFMVAYFIGMVFGIIAGFFLGRGSAKIQEKEGVSTTQSTETHREDREVITRSIPPFEWDTFRNWSNRKTTIVVAGLVVAIGLTIIISLFVIMPLVFGSIIQYPYYLFERYDGSITIFQYDYYGNLIPLANFGNLQHLVGSLNWYQPWGY